MMRSYRLYRNVALILVVIVTVVLVTWGLLMDVEIDEGQSYVPTYTDTYISTDISQEPISQTFTAERDNLAGFDLLVHGEALNLNWRLEDGSGNTVRSGVADVDSVMRITNITFEPLVETQGSEFELYISSAQSLSIYASKEDLCEVGCILKVDGERVAGNADITPVYSVKGYVALQIVFSRFLDNFKSFL